MEKVKSNKPSYYCSDGQDNFSTRNPSKPWSPCTTGSWGIRLPMSFPWTSQFYGFWYLWHPCGKHWLLQMPKGWQGWSKITTTKALVVSSHIHETEYHLHLRPSGHISWKHAARKRKYMTFWQLEHFWHYCKCDFISLYIYLELITV